jgi:hypothetical protein
MTTQPIHLTYDDTPGCYAHDDQGVAWATFDAKGAVRCTVCQALIIHGWCSSPRWDDVRYLCLEHVVATHSAPAPTDDRSIVPDVHGWDGFLTGHITCSCGAKTRFTAYHTAHIVACRQCQTEYLIQWENPRLTRTDKADPNTVAFATKERP